MRHSKVFENIINGGLEFAKEHLTKSNANMLDSNNQNLLVYAIRGFNIELFEYLLELGTDPSIILRGDETLFHIACSSGQLNILEVLYNLIPEHANKSDVNGDRPIHFSAKNGNTDILDFFLSKNIDISIANDLNQNILHLSILYQKYNFIERCLKEKICIHKKDENGNTPLHLACQKNSLNIIELLFSKGANFNFVNNKGMTPGHFIAEVGNIEKIDFFISSGGSLNFIDNSGYSFLDTLNNKIRHYEADYVKAVFKSKSYFENKSNSKLCVAVKSRDYYKLDSLLKQGADYNKVDNFKNTPLYYAVCQENIVMIKSLLQYPDIDINKKILEILTCISNPKLSKLIT